MEGGSVPRGGKTTAHRPSNRDIAVLLPTEVRLWFRHHAAVLVVTIKGRSPVF